MTFSILLNLIGLLLIIFIIWWFIFSKPKPIRSFQDSVTILVENGVYSPAAISAKINQPITLVFVRKDHASCAEYVVFSEIDQSYQLPLNTPFSITITPNKKGKIEFTCQMGMYRGYLIVDN